ncbi:MAG: hypothetical protein WA989_01780 [Henriciella sp.]|uniref:hypothetical protein n=1 Tax=Henriciella sp. TaxID=1968823 RepID=UPI003C75F30B
MTLNSVLSQMAADSAGSTIQHANLASGGQDLMGAKASQAVAAGFFPLEVAFVVLACLIVSGFVLLARESRIEKRTRN